jgi:hypothetical protein
MDTTALAERLEELRDELADYSKGLRGQGVAKPCNTTDIAALTEAATRLRAVAGEPVAYISQQTIEILNKCRNDTHNGTANVWMRPEENGYAANIPLYTHPQPATPASGDVLVGRNDDGSLDEVIGAGEFHLEQMDAGHWSLRLGRHLIGLQARGTIRANFIENDLPLPAPNPEQPARAKGESHE